MSTDFSDGLCRSVDEKGQWVYDLDMWFLLGMSEEAIRSARLVCADCPLKSACLEAA
jgi:hypothetical protein